MTLRKQKIKEGNMKAWFQCFEGCTGKYPLNEVIYRCPQCNNLLEVAFDMDELRKRSGNEWKKLFDERQKINKWPYGSSIWGKKEWVCPDIDDENIVSTSFKLRDSFPYRSAQKRFEPPS